MNKRNNNSGDNSEYEDFASFATCRISTLTKISGHLKGIFSDKITQLYVYFNLSVYISRDFSLPLAIEMQGRPFFSGPSLHRGYYCTLIIL